MPSCGGPGRSIGRRRFACGECVHNCHPPFTSVPKMRDGLVCALHVTDSLARGSTSLVGGPDCWRVRAREMLIKGGNRGEA